MFMLLLAACSNNKEESKQTKAEQTTAADQPVTTAPAATGSLQAPDFTDPELKLYYSRYTDYINKVVTAVRNKDEAGAMTLFREEGKLFNNSTEMEKKAKLADEGKFNAWLMQSISLQQEVVQSDFYKKFNEEYYKKVKEDFEKKNK